MSEKDKPISDEDFKQEVVQLLQSMDAKMALMVELLSKIVVGMTPFEGE